MKKIYTKMMALVCMFLLAGANAWGATTVWNGTMASTLWKGGSTKSWLIDPTSFFEVTSGQGFWIKADASGTNGLTYEISYHALVIKYLHTATLKCDVNRTVCFTMEGGNSTPHAVQFVNKTTGEVIERHVTHAKSTTQGAGSYFTVDFEAGIEYSFSASHTGIYIKKIEYLVPGQDIITLDEATENSTNYSTITGLANSVREIKVKRTLRKDQWNTLCLPVSLSASTKPPLEEALGTPNVYVIGSYDATENTLTFTSSTTLPANTPVLIKPTVKVVNPVFEYNNVSKPNSLSNLVAQNNGLKFVGLYGTENIYTSDHSRLFLGSDGTSLFYPESSEKGTIKGFRAYFDLSGTNGVKSFNFEDDATGIIKVENDPFQENGNVYTIDGRNLGNAKNLTPGIYVQNGRKFIVK